MNGAVEETKMPSKILRGTGEPKRAGDERTPKPRDEGWEERLRLVGDARFVDVEWSGRDNPSWPLPKR
jgi:hypothetical protein